MIATIRVAIGEAYLNAGKLMGDAGVERGVAENILRGTTLMHTIHAVAGHGADGICPARRQLIIAGEIRPVVQHRQLHLIEDAGISVGRPAGKGRIHRARRSRSQSVGDIGPQLAAIILPHPAGAIDHEFIHDRRLVWRSRNGCLELGRGIIAQPDHGAGGEIEYHALGKVAAQRGRAEMARYRAGCEVEQLDLLAQRRLEGRGRMRLADRQRRARLQHQPAIHHAQIITADHARASRAVDLHRGYREVVEGDVIDGDDTGRVAGCQSTG